MYSSRRIQCTETVSQDLWLYLRPKALDAATDLISFLLSLFYFLPLSGLVNFILPNSTYLSVLRYIWLFNDLFLGLCI